ncbi:hypothetical protein BK010_09745 [Tenericutes bacterium MO-XQ]|nr:hypothetical protein BK010_09745 [Tenericutes bacterium MO-XQ]
MYIKIIGYLLSIAFVALAWYIYIIYPSLPALIFAILVTVVAIVSYIRYYFMNKKMDAPFVKEKPIDMIRITLAAIAFLSFLGFFGLNVTYGGSAASDAYARESYENYEIGSFYLSDHGNFVKVSEDIWQLMSIAEKVVFPLFIVAFLWNFIAIVKEKGLKSSFSRK